MSQPLSFNEIRKTGIEILTEKLGAAGMIRFLQQSEMGDGDYTKERENLMQDATIEKMYQDIKKDKF